MTGIGLPEKRHYEIDIPAEDWPVPTFLPEAEQEPVPEPVPDPEPERVPVPG
jgi:hypothetical protein